MSICPTDSQGWKVDFSSWKKNNKYMSAQIYLSTIIYLSEPTMEWKNKQTTNTNKRHVILVSNYFQKPKSKSKIRKSQSPSYSP